MKQSAILQSGDHHHPQPLKIFNICDKNNALLLRPPSDEQQQQHLRVAGKRQCVSCLFNDPSSVNNLCLSAWSGSHLQGHYIYNLGHAPSPLPPRPPVPRIQSPNIGLSLRFSGTDETFAPAVPRIQSLNIGLRHRFSGEDETFATAVPKIQTPNISLGGRFSGGDETFVPAVPRIQSPNIGLCGRFSGGDETFAPAGGWNIYQRLVAKEINVSPHQSAIVPYRVPIYQKGGENSCVLSLGGGFSGKGKEVIVSSMVGSPNNIVPPSRFSLLPSGVTDNDVNNVPRKNKRKRQYSNRKMSVYSFPTNVKNLLSTGIFEGVPVKYVSWSREQNLKGVIKGTNYLCSCDRCKMNTAVNAYEFEKHAGCDTKHPNNHIYFPSGKSLYSVVQDLKGIVQIDLLFEAIRTASGTPINIKNFLAWKELYESASNPFRANPMNY